MAQRFRLGGAALREQCASEQRRGLRCVDAEPEVAQPLVGAAQRPLGGDGVAFEQIDLPAEHVGLEQSMRDAELFDHLPRRGDHATCGIGTAAQRFEHGLTAERHGLDGRRALRDAQYAHDVEAAPAGARDRARSPERSERCAGEHGVCAATISRAASRGERAIESRLARADLAETRQRLRVHEVRLRLAGCVAESGQRLGRCRDGVRRRMQRLRRGEHGELAREAGVPCAQSLRVGGEAAELVDRGRSGPDVAGGEQRLAPVEREIGARSGRRRRADRARGRAGSPPAADRHAPARVGPPRRDSARPARRARGRSRRSARARARC